MRTLVPFALALVGTVAFTADVSAFGKRGSGCNGGGYGGCSGGGYGGGYGGCSGGGYVSSGYGCGGGCYCGGSVYNGYSGSGGYGFSGTVTYSTPVWSGGSVGYPATYPVTYYGIPSGSVTVNGAKAPVIRTTDGSYYSLGADGNYYSAGSNGAAMPNGYATQPYYGAPTTYRSSSYYPSGFYPAGYPGAYTGPGVIPAGGNVPQPMPGGASRRLIVTSPGSQTVTQDRTDEMTVSINRNLFEGPVTVRLHDLPKGVEVTTTDLTIPADKSSLKVTVKAAADAPTVTDHVVKVNAKAKDQQDTPEASTTIKLTVKSK
jgi:hypothetical protein